MKSQPSIHILIPVYNRKPTTIKCLQILTSQINLQRYKLVVIDDGSSDGTAEAIQQLFPDIIILQGDGNLWWAGAIRKGMEYAYNQGSEFFIWLNDDTLPLPSTISRMVTACSTTPDQVISAQCYQDETLAKPTYGGRQIRGFSLEFLAASPKEALECDVCSGNLVCFHRSVIDQIGYPSGHQTPQTWADVVYTWRAKQAGFRVWVLGSATAVCSENKLEEGWATSSISMLQRWKMLSSPKSSIFPPAYWHYCQSIYGRMGIIPFIQVYLKLCMFTALRLVAPLSWIGVLKKVKDRWFSNVADCGNPER